MKANSTYRPELDGMRYLLAFLPVFLFHYGERYLKRDSVNDVPAWFDQILHGVIQSGAFGVDIFFCLSAFLITSILLRECDANKGDFNLNAFLLRRARRIWPLYLGFVVVLIALFPIEHIEDRWSVFALSVFFMGNTPQIIWSYIPASIGHLWSVTVEEQFYILWGVVLKRKPRHLSLRKICLIAIGISFAAKLFLLLLGAKIWTNTLVRMDPIIAGILFADLVRTRGWSPSGKARLALLAFGILVPVAIKCAIPNMGMHHLWFYPLVAACSAAVLGAVYGQTQVPIPQWIAYLGKISYGLYMFHMPVLVIFDKYLPSVSGEGMAMKVARAGAFLGLTSLTIFFLAWLSYEYWEKRWLKSKESQRSSREPALALAS